MMAAAPAHHSVSSEDEEDVSSGDEEGGIPGGFLVPYRLERINNARKHRWPQNWSRKEEQYTGSYTIWKNHFGLSRAEWEKVRKSDTYIQFMFRKKSL